MALYRYLSNGNLLYFAVASVEGLSAVCLECTDSHVIFLVFQLTDDRFGLAGIYRNCFGLLKTLLCSVSHLIAGCAGDLLPGYRSLLTLFGCFYFFDLN